MLQGEECILELISPSYIHKYTPYHRITDTVALPKGTSTSGFETNLQLQVNYASYLDTVGPHNHIFRIWEVVSLLTTM